MFIPEDYILHQEEMVSSTNDLAKEYVLNGGNQKSVFWAKAQTSGRGRQNREWTSEPGNLYVSIALPNMMSPNITELSFVIALSLRAAINECLGQELDIKNKWPNDLLWDDKKFAGILIEMTNDALIVGVGVNIAHHPKDTMFPATDLGNKVKIEDLLSLLIKYFDRDVAIWKTEGFAGFREKWLLNAWKLSEKIEFSQAEDNIIGVFESIDINGCLLLQLEDGTKKRVLAGDVLLPQDK